MRLLRPILLVTLCAGLLGCAPTADPSGLTGADSVAVQGAVQAAATTARLRQFAPDCVRYMRGQPIDTAALATAGYSEVNTLAGPRRIFRTQAGRARDRQIISFGPNECNFGGGNYIPRQNSGLTDAVGQALAPQGFRISRGNSVGLNSNATLLVASDISLIANILTGSGTSPAISLDRR